MFAAKEAIFHVWDYYARTVDRKEANKKLGDLIIYIQSLMNGVH